MIVRTIIDLINEYDGVGSVAGDVIPGPPPDYRPNLVLNVVPSDWFVNLQAHDKVLRSRRFIRELLELVSEHITPDFEGYVSIRLLNNTTGLRDYCANLSSSELHKQRKSRGLFWRESSQDDYIDQILREGS